MNVLVLTNFVLLRFQNDPVKLDLIIRLKIKTERKTWVTFNCSLLKIFRLIEEKKQSQKTKATTRIL